MTEKPDPEAIAALEAYYDLPPRTYWGGLLTQTMRRALDAAAEWRLAQPTSALADDARKIAERLRAVAECETPDVPDVDFQRRARYDLQEIASATLSLAEALPGKIEALQEDIEYWKREFVARGQKIEALAEERDSAQSNARRCSDDYMAIRKTLADTEHQVDAQQSQPAEREAEIARLKKSLIAAVEKNIALAALVTQKEE